MYSTNAPSSSTKITKAPNGSFNIADADRPSTHQRQQHQFKMEQWGLEDHDYVTNMTRRTTRRRVGRRRSPEVVFRQHLQSFPVAAIHLGQTIDLEKALKTHLFATVSSQQAQQSSPHEAANGATPSPPPQQQASSRRIRKPYGPPNSSRRIKLNNMNQGKTPLQRLIGKNSIVIELPPSNNDNANGAASSDEGANGYTTMNPESHSDSIHSINGVATKEAPKRYLAVFRFGSVVGINIPPHELQSHLTQIQTFVSDPVQKGSERREHFDVRLAPTLAQSMMSQQPDSPPPVLITGDYCVVTDLDLNGVAVISTIMAQTVALDTYNDTVDDLLSKFAAINSSVRASGTFESSHKSFLFKSVAQNNAIFIDMISKIRLKDRSDMAWNHSKYEEIHDGLKLEFEIDDRFDQIEYKLNLIQQNSKFFLEVLESEKSNSLEWIIVGLIGAECVLMCIEMSGLGEVVFEKLWSYMLPLRILIWGE